MNRPTVCDSYTFSGTFTFNDLHKWIAGKVVREVLTIVDTSKTLNKQVVKVRMYFTDGSYLEWWTERIGDITHLMHEVKSAPATATEI